MLSNEELAKAIEMLKKEGIEKFRILTINESNENRIYKMKKFIMFLNLPMCVLIPAYVELILSENHPKYNVLYIMLYMSDTLFFMNLLSMYTIIRSTAFAINYLPNSNTITIDTFTKFLKKQTIELKPTQLARCP